MFYYNKLAQAGVSAISYLAAVSDDPNYLAGSAEVAKDRHLSHMLVAKILTMLSAAGLVEGKRGPSGGYRLAKPAGEISLLDVVKVFEDPNDRVMCPFGPNWCGVGPNCPMHETFIEVHEENLARMEQETFAQFIGITRNQAEKKWKGLEE